MGGLERRDVVPALKDAWKTFQRLGAPVAQDIRMDAILGTDLG